MAAGCHHGFDPNGSSVVRSATPIQEPNMRWIAWPIAENEIWSFAIVRFFWKLV